MRQRYFALVLAAVGLLMGAQAFASGSTESGTDSPWETITVTGKVSFKDMPHPEITSGGKTYELVVPRYSVTDLNVKAGDTITVVGILIDRPVGAQDRQALMVTKATINGKEYVVPVGRGGFGGMMGPGYRGWGDADDRDSRGGMMGRGRR